MGLPDELVRGFDSGWSEVTTAQRGHAVAGARLRRRTMVAGDGRDQGPPTVAAGALGELERLGGEFEQAQTTGAVIVVGCQARRIIIEAIGIVIRRLGLKLLGELSDVVQSQEVADQRISVFARQAEQTGEALAVPAFARHQHLADRGHVEGVVRERVPPRSALRVGRLCLSPETEHVHRGLVRPSPT